MGSDPVSASTTPDAEAGKRKLVRVLADLPQENAFAGGVSPIMANTASSRGTPVWRLIIKGSWRRNKSEMTAQGTKYETWDR